MVVLSDISVVLSDISVTTASMAVLSVLGDSSSRGGHQDEAFQGGAFHEGEVSSFSQKNSSVHTCGDQEGAFHEGEGCPIKSEEEVKDSDFTLHRESGPAFPDLKVSSHGETKGSTCPQTDDGAEGATHSFQEALGKGKAAASDSQTFAEDGSLAKSLEGNGAAGNDGIWPVTNDSVEKTGIEWGEEAEHERAVKVCEVGGAPGNPETQMTHIHDLPDGCLVLIMCCLGTAFSGELPIRKPRSLIVQHPLQCALVCKRWFRLTDGAVNRLDLSIPDEGTPKRIGDRFLHLKGLGLRGYCTTPEGLVALSKVTPELQHLDLDIFFKPSITIIREVVSMWTRLRRLNLHRLLYSARRDYVASALDAVSNLQSLEHLAFGFKGGEEAVFAQVSAMTGLSTLHLHCTAVPPKSLARMLKKLELVRFGGTQLPNSLGLLTNLEDLHVDNARRLTEAPKSLTQIPHLTHLQFQDCYRLISLPSAIGTLTDLKVLRIIQQLPGTGISMLPKTLVNLHSLQTLEICCGPDFPKFLGTLTCLECLKIYRTSRLPEDIGDLPRLIQLKLFFCNICEVPSSFGHLSSLQDLQVCSCSSPPGLTEAIGMLTSLTKLEISHCDRMQVPPRSLCCLTALKDYTVKGFFCLTWLPKDIANWQMLTSLRMFDCNLALELPDVLGRLASLRELEVHRCKHLHSLQLNLHSLRRLRLLHLRDCPELKMDPEIIKELKARRVLSSENCPF